MIFFFPPPAFADALSYSFPLLAAAFSFSTEAALFKFRGEVISSNSFFQAAVMNEILFNSLLGLSENFLFETGTTKTTLFSPHVVAVDRRVTQIQSRKWAGMSLGMTSVATCILLIILFPTEYVLRWILFPLNIDLLRCKRLHLPILLRRIRGSVSCPNCLFSPRNSLTCILHLHSRVAHLSRRRFPVGSSKTSHNPTNDIRL